MLTSRFAMWMSWGPELTVLYNDAYARMTLGKKHPWALGRPAHEVWEEIWPEVGPRVQRVLETAEATWDEGLMLFLERSGYREETYHTFSYSPLFDDSGDTAGHLCVVSEETDRVIGERRLHTLRSLSAELNNAATEEEVVAAISRCLAENEKDLPFTLTYLLTDGGKRAKLACHTEIQRGEAAAPEIIEVEGKAVWPLAALLEGKDSVVVEDLDQQFSSLPSGAWDRRPARAVVLPLANPLQEGPAGALVAALNPYRPLDVGYAGFVRLLAGQISASIAKARAYEEERKRSDALAELDRAKTAFFSNVSHEFRTPLTLMLGPLEDLLQRGTTELPSAARQQLELVSRNGARLLRLVNTLLDFSRIEANRAHAVYEPTDLAAFTAELASAFHSATEKAGLRLNVNCRDLGESNYIDREMWEKIVLNLLSNAFKFTLAGEIAVSVTRSGDGAELKVRDTGVGIPAEAIPRLFERFYRVPNSQGRTHEGTGIGLALVQELVKLQGGSIRVESVLGQGTTFVVTVPFGKAHVAAGQIGGRRELSSTATGARPFVEEALRWLPDAAQEPEEIVGAATPLPETGEIREEDRPLILIADDNADMRQYLARLLTGLYRVETAADGIAAVSKAKERRPNLILTDVMMPGMNGFDVLKAVREDENTRRIPVVLLSARAGEEARVEGMQAGADDYLVKPFAARELLARIAARLEIVRLQGEGEQRYRDLAESLEEQVKARTEQLEQRTAELVKRSEDLRKLSAQLLHIQDKERRHIARELHDSAGQTLAMLGMNLGLLAKSAQEKLPEMTYEIETVTAMVQQLQKDIRTASYLLHPPLLDENGLSSALAWYTQGVKERTGLDIKLEIEEPFGRLQRDAELVLFRLVQECLTNIHRHSGSTMAQIRLQRSEDNVLLEVSDDGKGISAERLAKIEAGGAGVGIRGMQERVEQLSGTMQIESGARGTRVRASIPLNQAEMPEEAGGLSPQKASA